MGIVGPECAFAGERGLVVVGLVEMPFLGEDLLFVFDRRLDA
jgi:hypothetical protein